MTIFEMCKGTATLKVMLIVIGLLVFSFDVQAIWIIVGIVALLGSCFLAFRQGGAMGHEACSVAKSIERAGDEASRQFEPKMFKRVWSKSTGVKTVFAGGLVGYIIGCIYIVCALIDSESMVTGVARLVAWLGCIPYWPIVAHWHETYVALTPDVIVVLLAGPFLLPLCQYIGYLQGPALWAKTEKAMADGKRRAKARSRIVKKNKKPRARGPEI